MQKQINYKGIFVAGCAFMAAGIVYMIFIPILGISILGTGIGLMAIGLARKEDWDQED